MGDGWDFCCLVWSPEPQLEVILPERLVLCRLPDLSQELRELAPSPYAAQRHRAGPFPPPAHPSLRKAGVSIPVRPHLAAVHSRRNPGGLGWRPLGVEPRLQLLCHRKVLPWYVVTTCGNASPPHTRSPGTLKMEPSEVDSLSHVTWCIYLGPRETLPAWGVQSSEGCVQ